ADRAEAAAMVLSRGRGRKYLVLLVTLVFMLVAQPLLGPLHILAGAFFDGLIAAIATYAFFIVFEARWQRWVALAVMLPVFASNVVLYAVPVHVHRPSAVVYHSLLIVFLAFAVAVILKGIFGKRVIHGDDVLGAFTGYMLAAVAWANLY